MTADNRQKLYSHLLENNLPIPASLEAEFGEKEKLMTKDTSKKRSPKKGFNEV